MTETADRRAVETAIAFLSDAMRTSGHNPKPVVVHSVRVGMALLRSGYQTDTVVAGILHDVVEDSATSLGDVRRASGAPVAALVEANTFDPSHDRATRDRDTLNRCLREGREALLIKCADLLENWEYFLAFPPKTVDEVFRQKTRSFLLASEDALARDTIWRALQALHDRHMLKATHGTP